MYRKNNYHFEDFRKVPFSEVSDWLVNGDHYGIYYMNNKGIIESTNNKKFTLKELNFVSFYIREEKQ